MDDDTTYLTLLEMATKWKVSLPTARNRTRSKGFPPPFVVGPRTLRWPEEEVTAWVQQERRSHVVTKTQPTLRQPATRKPAQVRKVITRAA